MSSISSINNYSQIISVQQCNQLSTTTKMRLEALGIDPSTVTSEAQALTLIAQVEAAKNQNNSGKQGGNSQQHKSDANTQQNIFNTMDMISVSNKLILGL